MFRIVFFIKYNYSESARILIKKHHQRKKQIAILTLRPKAEGYFSFAQISELKKMYFLQFCELGAFY